MSDHDPANLDEGERLLAAAKGKRLSDRIALDEWLEEHAEALIEAARERDALAEWKTSVLGKVKRIPEYTTGKWGGDKEGWGFVFELIGWQTREVERLRAEVERLKTTPCERDHFKRRTFALAAEINALRAEVERLRALAAVNSHACVGDCPKCRTRTR